MLISCSAERKLARKYVREHQGEGIMLMPTNFLYKENPGAYIDTDKFPSSDQQDSVAFYSSNYVQYVSDSMVLTLFTNYLIDGLVDYGYKVNLEDNADQFLSSGKPTWIIQLSQLQLEENFIPRYIYGYDDEDEEYMDEYRQNVISLNSWLEVNHLNAENARKQMLYLSGFIEDDPNQVASLEYYKGQFYMVNSRDTISMRDVYSMAAASGKKHAELLFDYFMNDYIRVNMPAGDAHRKEMHFDRKLNRIQAGLIEKFDLVR
ncbi:MAG: hypothetical protein HXX13_15150 [Bacteroidetes bacterium]|nr:hypothetical protein [Bacteroidota bacterium]